MVYKIKATFAEGVTLDQLHAAIQQMGVGPDNPAPGNINHEESVKNNQVVFIEEWESQGAFETFFTQTAHPVISKNGIASPEIKQL